MQRERIIEQLDHMVESGRITPEEAARLRAAEGTAEFDAVLNEVRARHAGALTQAAVADGGMRQEEADALLERVRHGEHPEGLRSRLRRHGPGQPT
jgi:polyhydroxyalkanoate synthesis regulator phasin